MDMLTSPDSAATGESERETPTTRKAGARGGKSPAQLQREYRERQKAKKAADKAAGTGGAAGAKPGENEKPWEGGGAAAGAGDESFTGPKDREKPKARKKTKSADPDSVKIFANMLGGVYFALAQFTQTPEWMLSEPEAVDYATDICTALEYFEIELDPKTMAISAALMKTVKVNAPRLQATAMRSAARRREAAMRAGQPQQQQRQQAGPDGPAGPRPGPPQAPQGQGGPGMAGTGPNPADMAVAAATTPEPAPPQPNMYGAPAPGDGPGVPD